MIKAKALLRKHFQIQNLSDLSDEEFAEKLNEALFLEQFQAQLIENAIFKVIAKVFGK